MIQSALGIDPDLHRTGLAVVARQASGAPLLVAVGIVCVSPKLTGAEAVTAMASALQRELPPWLAYLTAEGALPELGLVEAQRLVARPGMRHKRPDDIVRLAAVAGAALGPVAALLPRAAFVQAAQWKGQQPKPVNQARTYAALGLGARVHGKGDGAYAQPVPLPSALLGAPGADRLNPGDWKHVGDALGIALFGLERRAASLVP